MKDFCLPVYFIGFPKGKLSIKWKTICIFSTKGALCLWAPASPWWRLFLERVSSGMWSGLGQKRLRQHCAVWAALSPLSAQAGLNLILRKSGLTGPICESSAAFQRVKPQKQGLSQNALPTGPESLQAHAGLNGGLGQGRCLWLLIYTQRWEQDSASSVWQRTEDRAGIQVQMEETRASEVEAHPVPPSPALPNMPPAPHLLCLILEIPLTGGKASPTTLKMNVD